jgi:AraC family transcriptional regulator
VAGAMKSVTLHDYKRRVLRALVHIQQHLDDPLRLDELAGIACFSPCHFHRVFRGMVGESVKEHIRRLRLERAASHLKLGKAPVTQVALDAGYASHEAFTRAFAAAFGTPPSAFRASRRPRLPDSPSGVHYRAVATGTFRTLGKEAGMKVDVRRMPPLRVAFVRHVGPYHQVGEAWERLLPVLGKDGLLGGDSLFLGICHDDPEVTPPLRLRYDACVSVDEAFRPEGEIGVQVVAGGEYAVTTHQGPYDTIGHTYGALLGQWLPRSGRELAGAPCFEVYLNSPENTAADDLLTDIYAPLRDRS